MYDKLFLALIDSSSVHAEASRRAFSSVGLTEGQPKVLYILNLRDGLMQKELAALCGVRESTLTVLLGKIEEKGLVRRTRSLTQGGKFTCLVYLTDEGRRAAKEVETQVERLEEIGFRGFSPEERFRLLEMLSRVTDNLRNAKN